VFHVAERKLHELSYKPLAVLREYIQSRTGIDLFATEEIFKRCLLASEVRNLIAHNDCVINGVFLRRVASADPSIPKRGKFQITDEWARQTSYMLDAIVFDFDEGAAPKFAVPVSRPQFARIVATTAS
jgi:hypothetical protein